MLRPLFLLPLLFGLGFGNDVQRAKRGATVFTAVRWESPIRYTVDASFSDEMKKLIRDELQPFIDNTCIDFKEVEQLADGVLQYVNDEKCEANLGAGKNHKVHLSIDCNAVQHETMHALGFDHTHNRPDRDEYIKVDFTKIENITSSMDAFKKLNDTDWHDYGIPYEYASILHYLTINGMENEEAKLSKSPSLVPLDFDYYYTIGGGDMVFNDWKLINLHYKCPEKCGTQTTCKNGGYVHPHKCDECVCTQFYTGQYCDVDKNPIILNTGEETPVYWAGPALPLGSVPTEEFDAFPRIVHLIKAPEGNRIKVTIVKAENEHTRMFQCAFACEDKGIEIVDGDLTRVGKKFCCGNRFPYSFISERNIVGLHVYSNSTLDFVANVTFTIVDESYTLPPTTTTEAPITTTTEPRILHPEPVLEPETIELSVGDTKRFDDGFPYNSTILSSFINFDPSEYKRKPDRIIKAPEGSQIEVKVINVLDKLMKVGSGCLENCDFKAIYFVDGDHESAKCCCNKNATDYSFVSTTNEVVYKMYAKPGLDFSASVSFTVVSSRAARAAESAPVQIEAVEAMNEKPRDAAQPEHASPSAEKDLNVEDQHQDDEKHARLKLEAKAESQNEGVA